MSDNSISGYLPYNVKVDAGILTSTHGSWDLSSYTNCELEFQKTSLTSWSLSIGFVIVLIAAAINEKNALFTLCVLAFSVFFLGFVVSQSRTVCVYIYGPLGKRLVFKTENVYKASDKELELEKAQAILTAIKPHLQKLR